MAAEEDVSTAVRGLLDREQVRALCVRYATALDTRDWPLLASCFRPDAIGEYEGLGTLEGYDAIEQVCRAALEPLAVSQHLVGNLEVDVHGDEGGSTCAFQAQHVRPGTEGGDLFLVAGRYTDRVVREPAGWRIAHRRLDVLWTDGNPSVLGS